MPTQSRLRSVGIEPLGEPLISLRKQSRKQRRPHPLTCFVRDEVLTNFECHMVQVPLLAMDRDRIVRRVGDAIRFVVADDEAVLAMQEFQQNLGETPVAGYRARRHARAAPRSRKRV